MDDGGRVVQVSDAAVRTELARLRQEHRDLDSAIEALQSQTHPDNLQLQRLKKRKLVLKDRISAARGQAPPRHHRLRCAFLRGAWSAGRNCGMRWCRL